MNIGQAKTQIKNAIRAYFTKDEFGAYVLPIERQRPIFLMGPPGIGKTAIMEQIASELGVAIVSYSMTHHTRQSALGLPFITEKEYGGKRYQVSEYTMSEIIATVYDTIKASGKREGILFLDEINCVSETLAPLMLQFLQYKVFGRHRVPAGWIVVTAGNPPEYNDSVREFDVVTWDRLKRVDIEPDYEAWKAYASEVGVHPSILTYLDVKRGDFYQIQSSVDGKQFVTARGWEDLSRMIQLYEQNEIPVDIHLISQYLQLPKVAKDFTAYYNLFHKYRDDYQVASILAGKATDAVLSRAKAARFDERIALIGLMMDELVRSFLEDHDFANLQTDYMSFLLQLKSKMASGKSARVLLAEYTELQKQNGEREQAAGTFTNAKRRRQNKLLGFLETLSTEMELDKPVDMALIKELRAPLSKLQKEQARKATALKDSLEHAFAFCDQAFGADTQELLLLVTELTIRPVAVRFISTNGCEAYFAHNKELLLYERQCELIRQIEAMDPARLDEEIK